MLIIPEPYLYLGDSITTQNSGRQRKRRRGPTIYLGLILLLLGKTLQLLFVDYFHGGGLEKSIAFFIGSVWSSGKVLDFLYFEVGNTMSNFQFLFLQIGNWAIFNIPVSRQYLEILKLQNKLKIIAKNSINVILTL